ncbi:MAG: hypothetical protein ACOY0T_18755 [Myxococcota bacterium]
MRASRLVQNALTASAIALALFGASYAQAQTSATQKAAAEAAFQAGVELMARDKAAEACAKFESSQQMDPALGTMLRLADCYETIGKTASAWALFVEARAQAGVQGRVDREAIAAERANSLEQRLSKLELHVEGKVAGQELKINGVVIPPGSWDAALPVDPGKQRIEVAAPGYLEWSTDVIATPGPSVLGVKIPKLAPAPEEPATAPSAAAGAAPTTAPAKSSSGSGVRTLGYVTGVIGLGGLAVGGVFAAQAYSKNQDSLRECRKGDPNACSEGGVTLREDALTAGNRATVAFIAGGALLATGVTLLVLAPSRRENTSMFQPRLRQIAWQGNAGLRLTGEF